MLEVALQGPAFFGRFALSGIEITNNVSANPANLEKLVFQLKPPALRAI